MVVNHERVLSTNFTFHLLSFPSRNYHRENIIVVFFLAISRTQFRLLDFYQKCRRHLTSLHVRSLLNKLLNVREVEQKNVGHLW